MRYNKNNLMKYPVCSRISKNAKYKTITILTKTGEQNHEFTRKNKS